MRVPVFRVSRPGLNEEVMILIDMREICPTCTRYRDALCSGLEFRWESCEDLIEYEVGV